MTEELGAGYIALSDLAELLKLPPDDTAQTFLAAKGTGRPKLERCYSLEGVAEIVSAQTGERFTAHDIPTLTPEEQAANMLDMLGVGVSNRAWERWRKAGKGPTAYRICDRWYYRAAHVIAHALNLAEAGPEPEPAKAWEPPPAQAEILPPTSTNLERKPSKGGWY